MLYTTRVVYISQQHLVFSLISLLSLHACVGFYSKNLIPAHI